MTDARTVQAVSSVDARDLTLLTTHGLRLWTTDLEQGPYLVLRPAENDARTALVSMPGHLDWIPAALTHWGATTYLELTAHSRRPLHMPGLRAEMWEFDPKLSHHRQFGFANRPTRDILDQISQDAGAALTGLAGRPISLTPDTARDLFHVSAPGATARPRARQRHGVWL